ncbi:protein of unknown function (plasmid) [Caballeronia sp. S22]
MRRLAVRIEEALIRTAAILSHP